MRALSIKHIKFDIETVEATLLTNARTLCRLVLVNALHYVNKEQIQRFVESLARFDLTDISLDPHALNYLGVGNFVSLAIYNPQIDELGDQVLMIPSLHRLVMTYSAINSLSINVESIRLLIKQLLTMDNLDELHLLGVNQRTCRVIALVLADLMACSTERHNLHVFVYKEFNEGLCLPDLKCQWSNYYTRNAIAADWIADEINKDLKIAMCW